MNLDMLNLVGQLIVAAVTVYIFIWPVILHPWRKEQESFSKSTHVDQSVTDNNA